MKLNKIEDPHVRHVEPPDSEDVAGGENGGNIPDLSREEASLVGMLVALRDTNLMKVRIAYGNRLLAVEQGRDQMPPEQVAVVQRIFDRVQAFEVEVEEEIRHASRDIPEIQAVRKVKGIGPTIAAELYAMIDIERADTVSALWRYCGMGVVEGKAERRVKGDKLHYNADLKVVMFKIGKSFMMTGSPYKRVYDDAKAYYQANRPEWTKMHVEFAARRKMQKLFVSHLWQVWRTMKGLPTRNLYVEEHLGHTHIMTPQQFGWEDYQPVSQSNP